MKVLSVFAALLCMVFLVPITGTTTVIYVPFEAPSIQSAVNTASPGDTVRVAGRQFYYHENIHIDKPICLLGDGAAATVIHGSDNGNVILISSNNVHIKNLSAVHAGDSTFQPTDLKYADAAVQILKADSCLIEYCNLSDNGYAGLALALSEYNVLQYSALTGNYRGILFYDSTWHYMDSGSDCNIENKISHNRICGNTRAGIMLWHMPYKHVNNTFRGNLIADNNCGFAGIVMHANDISYNSFNNNVYYAIAKYICDCGGYDNSFHYNGFFNNNGGDVQALDDWLGSPQNYWNYNYWSDYTGSDNNSDGFGDVVYHLDVESSQSYSVDYYPLMNPQDIDQDEIIDSADNCMSYANPDQADDDFDYIGDACDDCIDFDNDGYGTPGYAQNTCPPDNCPYIYNPDQLDSDQDGVGDACQFLCGDVNFDAFVNILDVTFLVNFLYKGGPAPYFPHSGDVDYSCTINILDVTLLINYLYKQGPPPDCPEGWPCR